MSATADPLHGFDLTDAKTFANGHPFAAYDWLRAHAPVYRHPAIADQPAFWALTRYEDIVQVSKDNERYTSSRGNRLPDRLGLARLSPEVLEALVNSLIASDPPRHTDLRRPLQPSFLPQALRRLEPQVEAFVSDLVAKLRDRTEVEFVSEVASIVPIKTLCLLLGIPPEDEHRVFDWTNRLVGTSDPDYGLSPEESSGVYEDVFDYGKHLIERRRADPQNDLLSVVANLTANACPISAATRNGMFVLFLAAGNETTRNTLSGSIMALSEHPEERQRLVHDPSLIGKAVNEFLRYVSPVTQMMRVTLADVEVGGQPIPAGERVVLLYGAGNRDPSVFASPHRLDITRENAARHLSFGFGIHRCLGDRMAVLQIEIVLRALLRAFPRIETAGEGVYLQSNFVNGVKRLPVRLLS